MSLERIADSLETIARILQSLAPAQAAARNPAADDTRTFAEKYRDERNRAIDLDQQLEKLGAPDVHRFAVAQELAARGDGLSRTTLIGAVPLARGIGKVRAAMWGDWIDERFPLPEHA